MADNENQTSADSEGTQDTGARVFTQDEVNQFAAKERRRAEREMNELRKQLEAFQVKESERAEAEKTENQKAIEAAAAKAAKERDGYWADILTKKEIDAELRGQLRDQGYDPDLAVLVKDKSEIKEVSDIPEAIKSALAGKEWLKRHVQAQTGTPTGTGKNPGLWSTSRMNQIMATKGTKGFTDDDWVQIKQSMKDGTFTYD